MAAILLPLHDPTRRIIKVLSCQVLSLASLACWLEQHTANRARHIPLFSLAVSILQSCIPKLLCGYLHWAWQHLASVCLACSPVNKDRVLDAVFNLPRMQLTTDDIPGTPTALQVHNPLPNIHSTCSFLPSAPRPDPAMFSMHVRMYCTPHWTPLCWLRCSDVFLCW